MADSAPATDSAPARPRLRDRDRPFALFWARPMLVWQVAFFLVPLVFMVVITFWTVQSFRLTPDFSTANWVTLYSAGYFWDIYFRTVWLAFLAASLASIIAFPCAYTLAFRVPTSVRWLAVFLLITPFFTSYLARIYSWKVVLTGNGIINSLLEVVGLGPFAMVNNAVGSMFGYLTLVMPLVVLLQLFSLAYVDRNLVEAAHNLRCGPVRTIFLVVIPSARIGLILAFTFAFILSFGDYVSPSFLGGSRSPTLSILIVDAVKSGANWPEASVIAVTMVVTLLTVAFIALTLAYGRPNRGR